MVTVQEYLGGVEEWKDAEVMRAMFKAMPADRRVAPAAYDCKDRFWSRLIRDSQTQIAPGSGFTVTELEQRFTRQGVHPLCLGQVAELMAGRKELVNSRLLRYRAGVVHAGWLMQAARSVMHMLYVPPAAKQEVQADDDVLFLASVVEEQANALHQLLGVVPSSAMAERLCVEADVQAAYGQLQARHSSCVPLDVLLSHLTVDDQIAAVGPEGRLGYKVAPFTAQKREEGGWLRGWMGAASQVAVSDADKEVLTVKRAIATGKERAASLQASVRERREQALAKKREGDKKGAIAALKRMKVYSAARDKQEELLAMLEDIMLSISSAQSDLQIHEALVAGNKSLKAVLKHVDVDSIGESLIEVQDTMTEVSLVSEALADGLAGQADDTDLEAELAELVADMAKEESAGKEDAELIEKLGAVSLTSPPPVASPVTLENRESEEKKAEGTAILA